MSTESNEARRATIAQLRTRMTRDVESLDSRMKELSDKAFEFHQEAVQHKKAGREKEAIAALKLKIQYNKLAEQTLNRMAKIMDNTNKLNTINHKLLIRSLPSSMTEGVKNTDPTVNPNNNSLERFYKAKYSLTPVKNNTNTTNNNSNIEPNTWCNRLGRCFSRFTRKNKNKKNGGARKTKSMKARRRN